VLSFAYSRDLPAEDAEDAFGRAWVNFRKTPAKFEWRGEGSLAKWLKGVVVNYVKQDWERRKHLPPFAEALPDGAADAVPAQRPEAQRDPSFAEAAAVTGEAELDRIIHQLRAGLGDADRTLLDLLYFKRLNATEAGRVLGKHPSAVRKAHERLKRKLQTQAAERQLRLPPTWRLLKD
jgi:RNA polymerase sigma factor (sigma-70 family)